MSILQRQVCDIDTAYQKYADVMHRVAMAQLQHCADAQDAVQEAFVRYLTKHPPFFSEEHEKAWLLRVTVNLCHDIARKKKHHPTVSLDDITDLAAEDESEYRSLLETISALPQLYRSVVILHILEGFSQEETARILNVSLSAVKMRWNRARQMLKERIGEEVSCFPTNRSGHTER